MWTAVWTAIGVLLFLLGLLVSIAWHEAGHLFFAKRFGVRVTQYMIGFGRTVFSRQRGETEYGVKILPLGGYIRMVGMVPPGRSGRRAPTTTAFGPIGMIRQLVEDTRTGDRSQVLHTDEGRQFYQLHPFKRIVIMLGGPVQNLIFAVLLFVILGMSVGVYQPIPQVQAVSACVLPASAAATPACTAADVQTPAAKVGLRSGDTIVSFAGQTITSWDQMKSLIAASAGRTEPLTYRRNGVTSTVQVPIVSNTLGIYDDTGKLTGTTIGGFLGVTAAETYQTQSFGAAVGTTWDFIGAAAHSVIEIPSRIPALWDSIFDGKARDVNTPVGIVGAGRISGEILAQDTSFQGQDHLVPTAPGGLQPEPVPAEHAPVVAARRWSHPRRGHRMGAPRLGQVASQGRPRSVRCGQIDAGGLRGGIVVHRVVGADLLGRRHQSGAVARVTVSRGDQLNLG